MQCVEKSLEIEEGNLPGRIIARAELPRDLSARNRNGKFYLLLIARDALLVIPPREAEMLTTIFRLTDTVVTLNVAVVLPANTVTAEGTTALLELLLDKLTTKPPTGAGAVSVTVPTELLPPRTFVGLRDSAESAADG